VSADTPRGEHGQEQLAPGPGYETHDLATRPILWAAAALVVVAVIIHVGMWWAMDFLLERQSPGAEAERPLARELRRTAPPEPRLQASPRADLLELRAWEDRRLTTYAWVDRDAGVVRMPIDRAMDILLKRGLPTRASSSAAAGAAAKEQEP
jgi:hypothetical protein